MAHKMKIIDAYRLKKQLINEFGYREAGILSMIDDQPEVLLNRNSKGEIAQTNEDWFIMLSTEEKARFIAMFSLRRKCVNEGEFYESVKNSLINASELPEMPMILRKDIEEWLKDKREINVEGGKETS